MDKKHSSRSRKTSVEEDYEQVPSVNNPLVNRSYNFDTCFTDSVSIRHFFEFLSSAFDDIPFHITKNHFRFFKTKSSKESGTLIYSLIMNARIECADLHFHNLNESRCKNKDDLSLKFNVNTTKLKEATKNLKTNDFLRIYQKKGSTDIVIWNITTGTSTNIPTTEYISEECDINSDVINQDLIPFTKIHINELTSHCSTLTKTAKSMCTVRFVCFKEGIYIYSDNKNLPKKFFGLCDKKPVKTFAVDASTIKDISHMKKINERTSSGFFIGKDDNLIRIDTKIGCYGILTLYIGNQEPSKEN